VSVNRSPDFSPVARLIADARAALAFPAAAIEVGSLAGPIWRHSHGRLTYDDEAAPVTDDTLFDLASLTKVLAAAPLAMRLMGSRRLLLNSPVSSYVRDWTTADRAHVVISDLLEHAAGLTSWWDLYRRAQSRSDFAHEIATMPLEYVPRTRSIYSDLGFILLGLIVESLDGRRLDDQFADGLASADLLFRPTADQRHRTAPTEDDRAWRKRLLVGEVHDENAWALDGVAAHAGLFGTVAAVGAHARLVLETLRRPTALGPPWLMRRMLAPSRVPGSSRALGWDLMRPTSSCGRRLSRAAFGHTGFTGTSLWIDPLRDLYVVLLTNRVYPQRPADPQDGLARLRPQVHEAVIAALED
jgi:CubicO group peptidase (beta-lactamase class C family)